MVCVCVCVRACVCVCVCECVRLWMLYHKLVYSSSCPMHNRTSTGYVVTDVDYVLLLDCGCAMQSHMICPSGTRSAYHNT